MFQETTLVYLHCVMEYEEDIDNGIAFASAGIGDTGIALTTNIGTTDNSEDDDEDDDFVTEALIIYLMITRMRRRREKDRSIWVHPINQKRLSEGNDKTYSIIYILNIYIYIYIYIYIFKTSQSPFYEFQKVTLHGFVAYIYC